MTFKPKLSNSISTSLAEQQRQQNKKEDALQTTTKKEAPKFNDPAQATERIRIIFDDSGSMGIEKLKDARDGCVEFLRNCKINETAVAVHVMNPDYQTDVIDLKGLTTNLPALSILIQKIKAAGGTPMYKTLKIAQYSKSSATRFIVFSDGAPNTDDEEKFKEQTILNAIENKTPVDTVLITDGYLTIHENTREYILLKELADRTGGYFLIFNRNKVDFKSAFKYLAPSLREKLSDGKVRLALMAGELK